MVNYLSLLLFFIAGCGEAKKESPAVALTPVTPALHNKIGDIREPQGFTRLVAEPGSFTAWLRTIPLKKDKAVYLYNGKLKSNQSAQFAVIDIPVGSKDLQQCADAVMRLRAEYLYAQKKYAAIAFMDYTGKWYKWTKTSNRPAFESYLKTVFGWCGSASLEKQLRTVDNFNAIKAGDVLVQGGFPGHAMMVVDVAVSERGKKVFMLAQGYQPAQDMHVVVNPANDKLSPWYEITGMDEIITPEWQFMKKNLRTW